MILSNVSLSGGLRTLRTESTRYCRQLCQSSLFNKKINICIEGNIGCGKTTSLKHFKALGGLVEIYEEPVKQWRDFAGKNPLALMYEDPKRWSFLFQSLAMLTLFQRHFQPQEKPIRLMERSVYSARYFFSENLLKSGHLTDMEYQILKKWFDWEMEQHPVHIDLLIYLQTSPEVCLERIRTRQRAEEQIVSLDYLRDLHQLHEQCFVQGNHKTELNSKVLVINNNHDKITMEKKIREVISDLLFNLGMVPRPSTVTVRAHGEPP